MRPIRVKNMSGRLDRRSMPDEVGLNNFTLLLNASIRARGKRCRRGGWKKLLDGVNSTYNNEDLHDQLLGLQTYYESFETNITIPGGIDSYIYQYQFPSQIVPDSQVTQQLGYITGYPPDLITNFGYDYPPSDGLGILNYSWTIDPNYPEYSTSILVNIFNYEGGMYPAYGYGGITYVYRDPNTYLYQYCGTYPYVRDGCEEHITLISSIGNTEGTRTLVAGTKSRLYALNTATGNWKILADGLGSPTREEDDCDDCSPERWLSANIQNEIVFTNGVNPPLIFNPLTKPTGCNLWRAEEIEDLDTLNIVSAGSVGSWKGFLFFGDVHQDGARRGNRIIWSDYNEPRTFIPADDNLAGFQDLGHDEIILRIEPLNDFLFIFTTSSIWRASLTQAGDDTTMFFEEIYRGEDALHFKFSLVNNGDACYYWTTDRLLRITSFDKRATEVAWMRQASNAVFDGVVEDDLVFEQLNREACEHFVGGWNPQYKELWWSWPTGSNRCPTMSMVYNVTAAEEGADFIDHGFTAFHWWDGQMTSTLMDWLQDLQICMKSSLVGDLVKEGSPPVEADPTFDNPVLYVWNEDEDITQPAGPNSVCEAFRTMWLRDLCDDCDALNRFVMASVEDKTLKEYADKAYYREQLIGAAYVLNGYETVIQSGYDDFGTFDEKYIGMLKTSLIAEEQTTPNLLYGYLGYGPQPDCIRWLLLEFYDDCNELVQGIDLACLTDRSSSQDDQDWTRPDDNAQWPCSVQGKNLGYRFRIEGTGGGACFSNVEMELNKT